MDLLSALFDLFSLCYRVVLFGYDICVCSCCCWHFSMNKYKIFAICVRFRQCVRNKLIIFIYPLTHIHAKMRCCYTLAHMLNCSSVCTYEWEIPYCRDWNLSANKVQIRVQHRTHLRYFVRSSNQIGQLAITSGMSAPHTHTLIHILLNTSVAPPHSSSPLLFLHRDHCYPYRSPPASGSKTPAIKITVED